MDLFIHNLSSAHHSAQPKLEKIGTDKEKRAFKIFIAVTLLFFISFMSSIFGLIGLMQTPFLPYSYFINHFGNAWIYYILDSDFRNDAQRVLSKIRCGQV